MFMRVRAPSSLPPSKEGYLLGAQVWLLVLLPIQSTNDLWTDRRKPNFKIDSP